MSHQLTRAELAHDPLRVARSLLGCELRSSHPEGDVRVRLVEVEAYRGGDDPASHCYRGKTQRNAVMFGPAGHLYVYFVYGLHFCINVVCTEDGVPGAVLLRAAEVLDGTELARSRRPAVRKDVQLASGPARLAGVLGITREHNGIDLTDPDSPIRLLDGPAVDEDDVRTGPRVGVATAVDLPWRSWIDGSPAVSPYRRGGRRRIRDQA
ncbi:MULTISPECIES: DNA-3-methyladenine glycosylase [Saccharopolyspora]|uniref:DNA-3-methyladenine glycosylase n=1 Tax=Saccharopolyspora TaxID=1835 RepID=UPI001CD552CC|nr:MULTISPECIES: DNA-3-methyladenine glycosylase [Saccharopolyspora]MCA1189956.1 DNA-3-methyladenine glycosylase [Saccharopolyspora sp. 6T]MCA1195916.1 DNA-3-methyladenine glycosylase [Saccharopolyspora sp. 6V]MCA1229139.1 DNA-3-methyladenine glycosylase [Saccharopolyspora sp. 6M]MCA1280131.1 DNA-3-methyladenine glycosylase [Saccharopolyspora sp. 7B]